MGSLDLCVLQRSYIFQDMSILCIAEADFVQDIGILDLCVLQRSYIFQDMSILDLCVLQRPILFRTLAF